MNLLVTFFVLLACVLPPAHAQSAARSGKDTVDAICAACHIAGVDGAPKIGDRQAWSNRASQGLTNLTLHALEGIRKMPAHGGNPELSDLEVARAVTHMVNLSGGDWVEPASDEELVVERSGKQVVESQCIICHREGVDGAPKIGDLDAWVPRIKKGFGYLVRSAIHGHGGMPPRGGQANLTDSEIHSAIVYMYYPTGIRQIFVGCYQVGCGGRYGPQSQICRRNGYLFGFHASGKVVRTSQRVSGAYHARRCAEGFRLLPR